MHHFEESPNCVLILNVYIFTMQSVNFSDNQTSARTKLNGGIHMKIVLSAFAFVLFSATAFADTVIWDCSVKSNPNASTFPDALTISSLPTGQQEATVEAQINDPDIANALNLHNQLPFTMYGEPALPLPQGSFRVLLGEYVSGIDFIPVNGGVRIQRAYTDTYGAHSDPSHYWWFYPGECVRQ
jgi:hypothetical protein